MVRRFGALVDRFCWAEREVATPPGEILAGHSGQTVRMVDNHCWTIPLNRRGREYSTEPNWAVKPKLPNRGICSSRLADEATVDQPHKKIQNRRSGG
jgi:hypothetical protein